MHAAQACKLSTARTYELNLRRHVRPVLGTKPVAAIGRADCRLLLAACRTKGLSPKTLEHIGRTLSSLLSHAVEDGHLSANPAFRLGRYDQKADHPTPRIQALTPAEVQRFLAVARQQTPRA